MALISGGTLGLLAGRALEPAPDDGPRAARREFASSSLTPLDGLSATLLARAGIAMRGVSFVARSLPALLDAAAGAGDEGLKDLRWLRFLGMPERPMLETRACFCVAGDRKTERGPVLRLPRDVGVDGLS